MNVLINGQIAAHGLWEHAPAAAGVAVSARASGAEKHIRTKRPSVESDAAATKLPQPEDRAYAKAADSPQSPTPAAEPSVLDAGVLDNLRELDTAMPGFLNGILAMFLQETPARLDDIRVAIDRAESEAVRDAAHALRGSAGSMGAHRMATACEDLEHLASAGDLATAQNRIGVIEAEFARTRVALGNALMAA